MRQYTEASVPDQTGRTFLITGANTGIGFEAARVLAGRGAKVILGCRDESKARAAIRAIGALHPSENHPELIWLPLDLSSLASIRAAADTINSEHQLDILVNNAGIMMPPRMLTEDGFEIQFGVNHLGHFALTGLVLNNLLRSNSARIVNVSSIAHRTGHIDFDDIHAERVYSAGARYRMSKLANMLFTMSLQQRLTAASSRCIAVGCHPGIATTELTRHMPGFLVALTSVLRPLLNTQAEGALPTLEAATSPDAVGNDYYGPLRRSETARSSGKARIADVARDGASAERLWTLSESMTGVHYPF